MKRDRFWKGPYRLGGHNILIWVSFDARFMISRPAVDWLVTDTVTGDTFTDSDFSACTQWAEKRNL